MLLGKFASLPLVDLWSLLFGCKQQTPDDPLHTGIGCSVHLSYDPNAGVDAKLTDSEGDVTEYSMEWESN